MENHTLWKLSLGIGRNAATEAITTILPFFLFKCGIAK
jgi:hypothetical protein